MDQFWDDSFQTALRALSQAAASRGHDGKTAGPILFGLLVRDAANAADLAVSVREQRARGRCTRCSGRTFVLTPGDHVEPCTRCALGTHDGKSSGWEPADIEPDDRAAGVYHPPQPGADGSTAATVDARAKS